MENRGVLPAARRNPHRSPLLNWACKPYHGEDWRWRNAHCRVTRDVHNWIPATVPGSVLHDLWRAGVVPDPYYDLNSLLVEWVPQRTWLYKCTFETTPGAATLCFDGVDHECTVFLNDVELGRHTGMFCAFEFAVELESENTLAVVIEPAPLEEPQVGRTARVRTHKSRMSYWWDFCPRLVHLGIWRRVWIRRGPPVPRIHARLSPDLQTAVVECGDKRWEIPQPRLWSPEDPYLYEHEGLRYGVRHITLDGYDLVVNGKRTPIRGWNWVPADAMHVSQDKLEHLLRLAKNAGVNLLRVWGGGYIESEEFYNLCDSLGLMVWQEFILSSSGIESTPSEAPEYVELMRKEAQQIVPSLQHHPSLVLWCGGNELQTPDGLPLADAPVLSALCQVAKAHGYPWLPTSPSGPRFMNDPQEPEENQLDVHGPWEHQGLERQYSLWNGAKARLHSEFGVEGMSRLETLERTIPPEHRWPAIKANQHYFHRGPWWINEPLVQECFGGIGDLATLVRCSQFLQAEGLRYAVESILRRGRGCIPWQFNEPFPNAFCTSVIEHDGTPKPAYWTVRRAYLGAPSARFERMVWPEKFAYECAAPARVVGASGRVYEGMPEEELFFLDLQGGLARYLFARGPNLKAMLECPKTTVVRQGNRLTNTGSYAALNVWLRGEPEDNYFSLLPGESRQIGGTMTAFEWWNACST